MATDKEIQGALEDEHLDALARLAAVTEILTGLVKRFAGDEVEAENGVARDLIRLAAVEVMEAVLRKPGSNRPASPPWPPPRYHLPDERVSLSKDLSLPSMQGLKVWVGFFDDGQPAEMFVSKQGESSAITALLDALATAISIGLQFGIPWDTFRAKLERWTFEPRGVTGDPRESLKLVNSPLDYVIRAADVLVRRRRHKTPTEGP